MKEVVKVFEIYRLISPSEKSYVGLTCTGFKARFAKHISDWRIGRKDGCYKLCNAFKKYHPNTWKHEIIFVTESYEEAIQKEIEFIIKFDSISNGYNIVLGGTSFIPGRKLSEETKLKMSKSCMGRKLTEEIKKKISLSKKGEPSWWTGKHHSLEAREKIRIAKLNYKCTDAHRAALSRANSGINNPNYGKHFSAESKQKMSESRLRYLANKQEGKCL